MSDGYDGLDDLNRADLPVMPKAVSDTLDEWLWRMHGVMSGGHHVGVFLEWLHGRGYYVAKIHESAVTEEER